MGPCLLPRLGRRPVIVSSAGERCPGRRRTRPSQLVRRRGPAAPHRRKERRQRRSGPQRRRPPSRRKPCENAQVLARIGSEVILTGDLLEGIDEVIDRGKSKAKPGELEAQRKKIIDELTIGINELVAHAGEPNPASYVGSERLGFMQQLLRGQIETKLIYQDFRATVPKENMPNVEQSLIEAVRSDRTAEAAGAGERAVAAGTRMEAPRQGDFAGRARSECSSSGPSPSSGSANRSS